MSTLLNSMSLMLEEFYRHLDVVGVSSMTGNGVAEFFEAVAKKAEEFSRDYQPELEKRRQQAQEDKAGRHANEIGEMMKDMEVTDSVARSGPARPVQRHHADTLSDLEDSSDSEVAAKSDEADSENDEDASNGLVNRYKQALSAEGDTSLGETSRERDFIRYLNNSKAG